MPNRAKERVNNGIGTAVNTGNAITSKTLYKDMLCKSINIVKRNVQIPMGIPKNMKTINVRAMDT